MKKYFIFEFKRAFFSKNVLILIFMILICLIVPYYGDLKIPLPESDAVYFFIRSRCGLSASFLPLFAPLIACIPFSNSYVLDKESGILKYIYTKIETKKYLSVRLIINALVTGLVFLIPQIIMLIFLICTKGINNNHMEIDGIFKGIYYSSKLTYSILLIGSSFIFGAVYSTFALGISAITENKYLTIVIPYVYVIISATVFENIGLNSIVDLNVFEIFVIENNNFIHLINVVLYNIALFIIGSSLLYYFGEKRRDA